MKKLLFLILFIFVFVGGMFYVFFPVVETKEFYVDMRGWPELFHYNPKTKVLKGEDIKYNVLKKTDHSFSIKNDESLFVYHRIHFVDDEYEVLTKSNMLHGDKKKVAILTFSMGADTQKWENFYKASEKNFLTNHEKTYFVFTDNHQLDKKDNVLNFAHYDRKEESYNLKKFHVFEKAKNFLKSYDYIYFIDTSLVPSDVIGEEIFPDDKQGIVTLLHPCYYTWEEGKFPYENNVRSSSYIVPKDRKFYISKYFVGGTKTAFFDLMNVITGWVNVDLRVNISPERESESYLNKYLSFKMHEFVEPLILMFEQVYPTYTCFVSTPKKIEENKIILHIDGEQKSFDYDEKTNTLIGERENIKVARRTRNTLLIPSKKRSTLYHRIPYLLNEYEPLTVSKMMAQTKKKIAIITVGVGAEASEWNSFYNSVEKNFLADHEKRYFLFTDKKQLKVDNKFVKKINLKKQYTSLRKFHLIDEIKQELDDFDYVYFLDINLTAIEPVGEEVLPTPQQEMVYAMHPWHYRWDINMLPFEQNQFSKAYTPLGSGSFYVQNVFLGGTKEAFLNLTKTIKEWIDEDLKQRIIPIWKDESYVNKYLIEKLKSENNPLILTPEYIYPNVECNYANEFEPFKKMILKTTIKEKSLK